MGGSRRRHARTARYAAVAALAALIVGATTGCKDGDPISAEGLQPRAVFRAESRPPAVTDDFVSLRTASAGGGRIVIDVVVSDVTEPVFGVALTMTYPDGFSTFVGCRDGELFPVPRDPLCEERNPGELLISRNAVAPEPGVAVAGDRTVLQLEFLVFGVSEAPIEFRGQNIGGVSALLDETVEPIPVAWFAGSLGGE